ncbi:MAG: septum site-determining protein MinC [Anaerolineae bacterium]|nr:septum site-determining protein MinC [Anaerolineae bacterium]
MPIILKGTQQGILLQPNVDSWAEVLRALEQSLQDSGGFFRGGRVILELGTRAITEDNLLALRALLDTYDIELWVVLSELPDIIHLIRSHGIRTRLPGKTQPTPPPPTPTAAEVAGNALFIERTLRSGQRLQHPGHVVLLGDINPGAEVIAGGNIVVWGRVNGIVHAGALGNPEAVVCALDLMPLQLRIAGYISRMPEEGRRKIRPEIAKVIDGTIVVEPWTTRG